MEPIDLDVHAASSMLNWWPKIEGLAIPQPRTEYVRVDDGNLMRVMDGDAPIKNIEKIRKMVRGFGLPVFLRGADTSGKHSWKDTCYLTDYDKVDEHVFALAEDAFMKSMMGEVGIKAIFAREFIKMDLAGFEAFHGKMPVSKEVRCFINHGKKRCQHWYWFEEAIFNHGHEPDDPTWKEKLMQNNTMTPEDQSTINGYLDLVCEVFKDNWSVDFCRGADGTWYLIDMARGEVSYHHPHTDLLGNKEDSN